MTSIAILITSIISYGMGRIRGYWLEIKSIEEVEQNNRAVINNLVEDIIELRKQINESNTQVL